MVPILQNISNYHFESAIVVESDLAVLDNLQCDQHVHTWSVCYPVKHYNLVAHQLILVCL